MPKAIKKPHRFMVQLGRVVQITSGPDEGKIAGIVDIIDQNRVLVDGPLSGVKRQPVSFKHIRLTKFVINLQHGCRTSYVAKTWEKEDINKRFLETKVALKMAAKQKRANMTDFDRFKLYKTKQSINRALRTASTKISVAERKEKIKKRKTKPAQAKPKKTRKEINLKRRMAKKASKAKKAKAAAEAK